jgi:hypothetical protein
MRSKMNALKHGLDAHTLILPGEDGAAYRERLDAWRADFPPRSPTEESLLEQIARFSWQLDRADGALHAYLTERIALAQSSEARWEAEAEAAAEADRIGRLLVAGPYATVFTVRGDDEVPVRRRVGTPIHPDDPTHPARLLRQLESTAAGCRWLLDIWAGLRAKLEGGDDAYWQPAERLAAVHLLGKQPVDAADDPLVQWIYLCSFVLAPHGPEVFADQAGTMTTAEFEYFLERLAGRRVSEKMPPDRVSAREWLLAILDAVIAGLEARSAGHAARAEPAAAEHAWLAFHDSPQVWRLRRLQQRLLGSLLRTIDLLMKVRSQPAVQAARPEPTQIVAASPDTPETCKKLRNEPNASAPGEKPATESPVGARPDCGGAPANPEPAPDTDPARTHDGTPQATTVCEKIRNEPNATIEGVRFPLDDEAQCGSNGTTAPTPGDDVRRPVELCPTRPPKGRSGPPGRAGPAGSG